MSASRQTETLHARPGACGKTLMKSKAYDMHMAHKGYALSDIEKRGSHHYIQYMRHGDTFRQDMRSAHISYVFAALEKPTCRSYL
jgi:hypothetical protein